MASIIPLDRETETVILASIHAFFSCFYPVKILALGAAISYRTLRREIVRQ